MGRHGRIPTATLATAAVERDGDSSRARRSSDAVSDSRTEVSDEGAAEAPITTSSHPGQRASVHTRTGTGGAAMTIAAIESVESIAHAGLDSVGESKLVAKGDASGGSNTVADEAFRVLLGLICSTSAFSSGSMPAWCAATPEASESSAPSSSGSSSSVDGSPSPASSPHHLAPSGSRASPA